MVTRDLFLQDFDFMLHRNLTEQVAITEDLLPHEYRSLMLRDPDQMASEVRLAVHYTRFTSSHPTTVRPSPEGEGFAPNLPLTPAWPPGPDTRWVRRPPLGRRGVAALGAGIGGVCRGRSDVSRRLREGHNLRLSSRARLGVIAPTRLMQQEGRPSLAGDLGKGLAIDGHRSSW